MGFGGSVSSYGGPKVIYSGFRVGVDVTQSSHWTMEGVWCAKPQAKRGMMRQAKEG